jgi:hypothetical protein
MKTLRELHKALGKQVRKHVKAKHQKEMAFLNLWELVTEDFSPRSELVPHDFLCERERSKFEENAAKQEQHAALKAARLALVKTLKAAAVGASERG